MISTRIPLLAAAACLTPALAHADIITADGPISTATVYRDRAIVTRTAAVQLPSGEHEVIFDDLPLNLLPDSIQVTGLGAGVSLLDVGHSRTTKTVPTQPHAAELQKQIDGLNDHMRELGSRILANERALEVLRDIETTWVTAPRERNEQPAPAKPAALPSLEDYQKLMTFGEETRLKMLAARRAMDKDREELRLALTNKQRELAELGVKNPREQRISRVVLRLSAAAPVAAKLHLAYGVAGATWSPAYDARLAVAEHAVQLNYFGVVKNGTGEDWTGVALKLSTARPNIAAKVPELTGIKLNEVRPQSLASAYVGDSESRAPTTSRQLSKRHAPVIAAQEMAITAGTPADDAPIVQAMADVDQTVTAATFVIAAPANLPNDNTPHRVSIGEAKLPAELRYEIVPALSEFAYLTGKFKNTTELPFLSGPVAVFIDGTYVSASQFDTTVPQGVFTLAFGIDEGITVKRKPLNKFTEDTGITGKYDRTTYQWQTTVTNNRRTKETLVVKEVLPLSENEQIEVVALAPAGDAINKKDPAAHHYLDAQGILHSTHTFEPGQKQDLTFSYRIDRPKKMPINAPER